ncbi:MULTISPECIES: hypothetical protein [unclassified Janthinobacterium]|uniref:hypothetical protein n=1 Tax=unclassified Janthinobacterium TaxID=2610881 RepID=UPI0016221D40|nr:MULTISPECIES: hypothetical protein [unclassified Janthinobacterium]MBB5606802.1 hypothetical protein [Janthinobacterium sp. S3T4]MBB5612148.1 hypothetical protein [Janthinobacterium sp. S3M3]
MKINKETGEIEINDNIIIGKNTSKNDILKIEKLEYFGKTNEFETYSTQGIYFNQLKMKLILRFKNEKLLILEFIWLDGEVNKLGYESSNSELKKEKTYLSKIISRFLFQEAEKTTPYEDFFSFSWGDIIIKSDQKSSYCVTMIVYGKDELI